MNNLLNRLVYICAVFLMLVPLVSCSGGGGGSGASGGTTGILNFGLTDVPGDYQHVYVTIEEVSVHSANGDVDDEDPEWVQVLAPPGKTVDLLELSNGTIEYLQVELEAGQYNQMRLRLGTKPDDPVEHQYANYLVIEGEEGEDPTEVELRVLPSELKVGIKIVPGFEIVASGATEIILDFDAQKSVVKANGKKGWHLKPVIKVLETVNNSASGTVDAGIDKWLEGVLVTAQLYDENAVDLKSQVTVAGGAISDILGDYFMYLPPGTYNFVAAEAGYLPYCQEVEATGYQPHRGIDFTLEGTDIGYVTGTVTGLAAEGSATLSFRQTVDCEYGDTDVQVEVLSVNIAVDNSYYEPLSAGDYQLVVSADNEVTQEFLITVEEGLETVKDLSF